MPNSDVIQHTGQSSLTAQVNNERWPVFYHFIRRMMTKKLQKNMEQLYIYNLDEVRTLADSKTIILAPNHVAYWDSCLYFLLSNEIGARPFVYVAQSTLQRLPFLRWCGAVPVNTNSKEDALSQLRSATTLNTEPTQFWIFPQGEHRPTTAPIRCKRGVQILATSVDACIIPVSIQYLYRDGEHPIAYVRFQPALPSNTPLSALNQSLQQGLEQITEDHINEASERYTPYYKTSRQNEDDMPTRILSWIAHKILGDV